MALASLRHSRSRVHTHIVVDGILKDGALSLGSNTGSGIPEPFK